MKKVDFSHSELFHVFDYSCGLIRDVISKCRIGLQNKRVLPQKKRIFYSLETMLQSEHISIADMVYSLLIRCYIQGIKPIVVGHSGAALEIEKTLLQLDSFVRDNCAIYIYGGAILLKKIQGCKVVNIATKKDFISPLYYANEKKISLLSKKYDIEIIDIPVETIDALYCHTTTTKEMKRLFKTWGGWHSFEYVYFWDVIKKLKIEQK
jgi:hypothetical protein